MGQVTRTFDILEKGIKILMAILIGGMVALISLQVGFRYLLNQPLTWSEEVARHLMIWSALLGAAVAYRRKGHLGMDVIVMLFSPQWKRIVEGIVHLLSIGFFGLILLNGIPLVQKTMSQLSSAILIPMGYIYAALPVGSAFLLLFALEKLLGFYQREETPEIQSI
jgi:TRAP-type C4-dicarboxylate transport system permease small subunit